MNQLVNSPPPPPPMQCRGFPGAVEPLESGHLRNKTFGRITEVVGIERSILNTWVTFGTKQCGRFTEAQITIVLLNILYC